MKEKILSALKGAYANYDANTYNAVANALAASGLVTDENLADIISKQESALKDFQSEIDRRVSKLTKENEKLKQPKDEKKDDKKDEPQPKQDDEVPAWAKALVESNKTLSSQLIALQTEKTTTSRKSILESKLKSIEGLPDYYRDEVLEGFGSRNFTTDDDFNAYVESKATKAAEIAQKAITGNLSVLDAPVVNTGGTAPKVSAAVQDYLKTKQTN